MQSKAMRFLINRIALSVALTGILFLNQANTQSVQPIDSYNFHHLTTDDGLANNWCFSALKDSKGYMWFGTQDGLSRYDGYNFKNYQDYDIGASDSTTIQGSSVMDLVEDSQGYLWLATVGGGLVRYNPITESFKSYSVSNIIDSTENVMFVDIFLDGDTTIWLGAYDTGLIRFHIPSESFTRFNLYQGKVNRQESFRKNSVHEIIQDIRIKDRLWLAGNNGLYAFDKASTELEYFPLVHNGKADSSSATMHVFMNQADHLWVGTWGSGLAKFDISGQNWIYYFPSGGRSSNGNIIFDILAKSSKELWLASLDQGLLVFNKTTEVFQVVPHQPENRFSILSNSINRLYFDEQQSLWVLNYKEGISILDPSLQRFKFTSLDFPAFCPEGREDAFLDFAVSKQREEVYVVNSVCKTLFIFDLDKNLKKSIPLPGQHLPKYHLLLDSKDQLWISLGGSGGTDNLLIYNIQTQTIAPLNWASFNAKNYSKFQFSDLIEDRQGEIWIGTRYNGILNLKPASKSVIQHIKSSSRPNAPSDYLEVSNIIQDSQNRIWISSLKDGIYVFDPIEKSWQHFDCYVCKEPDFGLFEKRINSLQVDKDGMIWVGTGDLGLQILHPDLPKDQHSKAFRLEEGMPNEKITGILKDENETIWVATHNGLCRFDYGSQNPLIYDKKDGLKDAFLENGFSIGQNGEIFIGQEDGFYSFRPSLSYKNEEAPPIVFTNFRVFEEEIIFNKNLNYLEQIDLAPGQNFFSFDFAALNFSQPYKNRYAYQLEGFDKEWIYPSDNRNSASYTNVPPGNYNFRVKASNNEGLWNEEGISIKINLKAPWYKRWWASLLALVFITGTVWWLYKFQINRQLEKQEALRLKELDGVKNKLYTNITHEFRTPLTVIMGMTERLNESKDFEYREAGKLIYRNSINLLNLVNQMLDLSKLESGNLKLNLIQDDIISYLKYLMESFQSIAAYKEQKLSFYSESNQVLMDFDEDRIQQVISNLLSNALKFTPKGGEIILHCRQIKQKDSQYLQIKVKDSGIGIPKKDLPNIFDRFYQAENKTVQSGEGTGIGLALTKELVKMMNGEIEVESQINEGTTFTIHLPISTKAHKNSVKKKIVIEHKQDKGASVSLPLAPGKDQEDAPLLLLIEDNPDVVKYICSILEDTYNIRVANNGQDGIEKAIEIVPDIIISDVMMPLKDGFEVCQTLKLDERTSHIPIVLLTAKASLKDKIEGLEFGADAYLVKPFNKAELLIRLKKLIELRQKLQRQYAKLDSSVNNGIQEEESMEDVFLKKLRTIVEENIDEPNLSIADLCKAAHLSHTQVYRKLKALTDRSPSQFIRSIRLHKAKELLEKSDRSISEVAYDVGFNDPNYFSRTFLQEFGHSPSAARK